MKNILAYFRPSPTPDQDVSFRERIEVLERQMKGLRLEWEDCYEKLLRRASRVARENAWDATTQPSVDAPVPQAPEVSTEAAPPPRDRHSLLASMNRRHLA